MAVVPVTETAGPRIFPGTEAKQTGFRVPAVYRHCPAFADNFHTAGPPEPVPVSRASTISFRHHSSSSGTGSVICLNGIFRSPARCAAIISERPVALRDIGTLQEETVYINRFIPVIQTKNGHATENISGYNLRFIVSHDVITVLKPAFLCKRDDLHASNHQVIQQADVHQVQGLSEPLCYLTVSLARLSESGGMAVATRTAAALCFRPAFTTSRGWTCVWLMVPLKSVS
ncbi:hypothetical protein NGUA26_02805 [Salmonella enterica]|nr:hypothetical protein NGUA26_02805 [Salmonella enterica]